MKDEISLSIDTERCSKCAGEMELRRTGSTQGLFCKKCGWYLVTTHIPPMLLDETEYELRAIGGDFHNEAHVKAVAEVSGCNFLGARKLLQEDKPVVLRGRATEVARAETVLTAAGVGAQILPTFPHSPRR